MVLIYFLYLLFLIILLYFFLNFFFDLKIYLDNIYYLKTIELLKELDSLLLQRAEHLHKIVDLQDQLSTILITAQKKPLFDVTLDFLSNNSSIFVGISIFFIALTIINLFGKSDLEVLSDEITKAQELSHNLHVSITKEALTTSSDIFLNSITKLLTETNSLSMSNSTQKLEVLFTKLTNVDKGNTEIILQKLNELLLKSHLIETQILQILELLSK